MIVIDKKTGKEITADVKVIIEDENNYRYCRKMADDILAKADKIHDLYMKKKFDEARKIELRDPDWYEKNAKINKEADKINKEWKDMMELAGEWEDKEFAARLKPVFKYASFHMNDTDRPMLAYAQKNELYGQHLKELGADKLAKQFICEDPE